MKLQFHLLMLSIVIIFFTSCNSNQQQPANNMATNPQGDTTATAKLSEADAKFVKDAYSGGMMEVALGKLAIEKSSNARVKGFGQMMVTDHSKAGNELQQLAASKGLTVNSMNSKDSSMVSNLDQKSGKDFDKQYMKMMVDDHKTDVQEFKNQSTGAQDADIKNFAAKTYPVLVVHLDSATAINKSIQ